MGLVLATDNTAKGKGKFIPLSDITILDWIRNLIPARTEEEQTILLENLEDNGQQTPAIVTKIGNDNYCLIDGHGRYEALKELNSDSIWVVSQKFKDKQSIKDTMLRIQLGRRNLSENVKSRLRGEIWNKSKQLKSEGNDVPLTLKEQAAEFGITDRTLKKDAKFAEEAYNLEQAVPEAKRLIEDPTTPKTVTSKLAEIAKNSPHEAQKLVTLVEQGKTKDEKSKILQGNRAKGKISSPKNERKIKTIKLPIELANTLAIRAKQENLKLNEFVEDVLKEFLEK